MCVATVIGLTARPTFAQQQISAFGIQANSSNVDGFNACRIDADETNGRKNLVLLLSCRNKSGVDFRVPVAAQYRGQRNSWYFITENGATIPHGIICNVFAVSPSDGPTAPVRNLEGFVHHAGSENTAQRATTLDHWSCNGKPDAVVLVTERPSTGMSNWPTVQYSNGTWQISSSRPDSSYNVVVCQPGKTDLGNFGEIEAFTHTVTADNLARIASTLHDSGGRPFQNPDALVFVTPQQPQNSGVRPAWGAVAGQNSWSIKSEGLKAGQKFSVMVVNRLTF